MKRWIGWAVAVFVLTATSVAAAPGKRSPKAPPQEEPEPAPAAWCAAVHVFSTPGGAAGSEPTFSAKQTLDLSFEIELPERTGKPMAEPRSFSLKLFTPNGHLYQELVVRAKPNVMERLRRPGLPRLVKAGPVPVAGTFITQSALFGSWRATAEAPGQSVGCTASFVLEP